MPASAPMSAASRRAWRARGSSASDLDRGKNAAELAAALGGLKGPIMKVAQLLATIPDALPPEYIAELTKLQSQAPPMGWAFVKRRMQAELGADWQSKFAELRAPAGGGRLARPGASRARRSMARHWPASCSIPTCSRRSKPTCSSSDCCSRSAAASIRRSTPPRSIKEIGARLREELDYRARGQARRALPRHAQGRDADPRAAASGPSFRPAAC